MVLIGKDTRLSGYMIESALTSGICSMGMNVTLVGPLPTPGIAFLTRALRIDAGVVISASHNPFYDNGIKFFSYNGFKLPDDIEAKIEALVIDDGLERYRAKGEHVGKAFRLDDATGRYIEYIKSTLRKGVTFEGMKVVVDCANGSAYKTTPWLLRELGAEVISIHDRPNGTNINDNCGSLHTEDLVKAVLRTRLISALPMTGRRQGALATRRAGSLTATRSWACVLLRCMHRVTSGETRLLLRS
jgi:phosphoglucosamine mutase